MDFDLLAHLTDKFVDLTGLLDLKYVIVREIDIEQQAGGILNVDGTHQRRVDGEIDGIGETTFAAGNALTDDGDTALGKRLLDIVEVGIDFAHAGDDVGYRLGGVANQVVRALERLADIHILVDHDVFFVVHHEQRIDMLCQFCRSHHRLANLDFALESEGKRDDAHREDVELLRYLSNDRRSTRSRTTAHSGNDKDHLGAIAQHLFDVLAALFRQIVRLGGVTACAQTLETDFELVGHAEFLHGLHIGVANQKRDIQKTMLLVQLVDGIAAATTHADNLDNAIGGDL